MHVSITEFCSHFIDIVCFMEQGTREEEDAAFRDEPCAWFVTQTLPLAVHRLLYAEYLKQETVQKVYVILMNNSQYLSSEPRVVAGFFIAPFHCPFQHVV